MWTVCPSRAPNWSIKYIYLSSYLSLHRHIYFWNTLPQSVIDAKDVRQFEIRLNKYWEHQDVEFEYKASIQNKENTGNHTEIEVDIVAESQRPQAQIVNDLT
jgi:hypothetical protein